MGHPLPPAHARLARWVAGLPGKLGGLGLRSAERTAPAAYWASVADALPVIRAHNEGLAERILHELTLLHGGRLSNWLSHTERVC